MDDQNREKLFQLSIKKWRPTRFKLHTLQNEKIENEVNLYDFLELKQDEQSRSMDNLANQMQKLKIAKDSIVERKLIKNTFSRESRMYSISNEMNVELISKPVNQKENKSIQCTQYQGFKLKQTSEQSEIGTQSTQYPFAIIKTNPDNNEDKQTQSTQYPIIIPKMFSQPSENSSKIQKQSQFNSSFSNSNNEFTQRKKSSAINTSRTGRYDRQIEAKSYDRDKIANALQTFLRIQSSLRKQRSQQSSSYKKKEQYNLQKVINRRAKKFFNFDRFEEMQKVYENIQII